MEVGDGLKQCGGRTYATHLQALSYTTKPDATDAGSVVGITSVQNHNFDPPDPSPLFVHPPVVATTGG
ncbi:hypothetical protein TOC8172_22800 [Pseudomonas syringae]